MRLYLIPWGYVMAKRNPSSDDATTDLGAINAPIGETVDLWKLPPLAKFKKFQKKGK